MKTPVTLKLDADLLREARVAAAEGGRSLSACQANRLEAIVHERKPSIRLVDQKGRGSGAAARGD